MIQAAGGSGQINEKPINVKKEPYHNQPFSIEITVPPLGISIFMKQTKKDGESERIMGAKKWIAMLLAGGQGSRLGELTIGLAKPAVPFGGKYRIIDFPLSNCTHSGIDTVGVLTQYQPLILNDYVGNGKAWDLDLDVGGVSVLPLTKGKKAVNGIKGRQTLFIKISNTLITMIRNMY